MKVEGGLITSSLAAITVKRSSTREINPYLTRIHQPAKYLTGSIAMTTIRRSSRSSKSVEQAASLFSFVFVSGRRNRLAACST